MKKILNKHRPAFGFGSGSDGFVEIYEPGLTKLEYTSIEMAKALIISGKGKCDPDDAIYFAEDLLKRIERKENNEETL